MEFAAKSVKVTCGSSLYIAMSDDGEYVVKVGQKNNTLKCECQTYTRIRICKHVVAVITHRGPESFHAFVKGFKSSTVTEACDPVPQSGEKPSKRRKGGRTVKSTPREEAAAIQRGEYVVVRKSGRIYKCVGCKGSLMESPFVVQHSCSIPYPSVTTEGARVMVSPRTATNHYFHLNPSCIKKEINHEDFDGDVSLSPTVLAPSLKGELRAAGFKII